MEFIIDWTLEAETKFNSQLTFISQRRSDLSVSRYVNEFYEELGLLKLFPAKGRALEFFPTIRRLVIQKENIVYYLLEDKRIVLIGFWNTNWDPKDNPFE